jgi:hypothetical protein
MTILSLRLLRTKSPLEAMARAAFCVQSRVVSGQRNKIENGPPHVEGEMNMKKLVTSSLLTVVAVPFLMAAAPKAQNTAAPAATATTAAKPKVHKKHHAVKKAAASKMVTSPTPAK